MAVSPTLKPSAIMGNYLDILKFCLSNDFMNEITKRCKPATMWSMRIIESQR